ncbi:MAG: hypothetical protein V1790_16200 [Planctomycetota bacterium]
MLISRQPAERHRLEVRKDFSFAGIEILEAVNRFGGRDTLRQLVIEGIGPAVSALS